MKNLLIFISCFIALINNTNAQTTTIPDTLFELELIQRGIDSDGLVNGQILNSDAALVLKLDISNSSIKSLVGINAFVNLDTFICTGSDSIVSIDLSGNALLRYLDCRYIYGLDSLNVTGNFMLTYLNCGGASIRDLNVSNNTTLEYLVCASINDTSLNLAGNPALKYLNCSNMPLVSLDLTSNLVLEELYCNSNNAMTSFDVTNCSNLKTLNCSYSRNVTTIDVSGNPLLEHLDCSNLQNTLISIDVSGNPLLRHLNLFNGNLANIDVSGNPLLRYLNCTENYISTLNLAGNPQLEELYCNGKSSNPISLTALDLSGNPLLVYLQCKDNDIISLDLSNNPLLEILSCKDNNLDSLNVSNNPLLKQLDCSRNNLTSLDVAGMPQLEYLHCEENSIRSLDVGSSIILGQLYCHDNNLSTLHLPINGALYFLACQNNNLSALNLPVSGLLNYLVCGDNYLGNLDLMGQPYLSAMSCTNNLPNLRICKIPSQIPNAFWQKDTSAMYVEYCLELAVEGNIAIDANNNCLIDSLEQSVRAQQIIKFERQIDTTTYYAWSYGSSGEYRAYLDTGMYTVSVIPTNLYWQTCPNSQQVTIDTNYIVQTLDWNLQATVSCPMLEVDISAPFLRMTGGGSTYTVSYCNNGTVAAQNAYVEVDLDASLNFINSSIPVANQIGRTYTFNLGAIDLGDCGDFTLQVIVDTSAQFEQTHCTEVRIYPDSICLPLWSGPIVDGEVNCQNDTVSFRIDNTGTGMLQPQSYTIIENDVIIATGSVQLGANQSTTIQQEALDGKTYRIEVEQLTAYPSILGDSIFSKAIEGCNPLPNGSFDIGFITQFSNGYSSPFKAIDCQANVASYDPNDKAAQPEGYGSQHYIAQNVPIDYKIRFQNTGTDTAFNIIILDTLSSYLDLSTLQMGGSSHNRTWEIIDGNVLKVSFANIMLVDSNANEPLSHGFFTYSINQQKNNPLGVLIENQAAIYFDYNLPIFTNTTFHTVGEDFIPIMLTIEHRYQENVEVIVFPNPFDYSTTIKVSGQKYNELELSIFDVSGRMVGEERSTSENQVQLSRGNLEKGVYFYKLSGDGKPLNGGKLIVR